MPNGTSPEPIDLDVRSLEKIEAKEPVAELPLQLEKFTPCVESGTTEDPGDEQGVINLG